METVLSCGSDETVSKCIRTRHTAEMREILDKSNKEYIHEILMGLKSMEYIKPEEIPNLDLYMDQLTTFMDSHLESTRRYSDDKLLTKTMINNYTKNKLLPAPNKKKYSKEHMLLLIFIYYFKNILSISDIQEIFGPLTEKFYGKDEGLTLEQIYEEIFSLQEEEAKRLTKDVIKKFHRSEKMFSEVEDKEDQDFLRTFSFICMMSFDVYVKRLIIERLIDSQLSKKEEEE